MVERDTFRTFLNLPFDVCRLQEVRRSTSAVMVNSVHDSTCKVQIQLVNIRMDQWIWHHFLLVQLRTHSLYTCGMHFDKCFCFAMQNDNPKFHNVVFTPKRDFDHTFYLEANANLKMPNAKKGKCQVAKCHISSGSAHKLTYLKS